MGMFEVTAKVMPLTGADALNESGKSKRRKLMWMFLLIVFALATVLHVVMRLRYYVKRTKIVSVEVKKLAEMNLPPIQICFPYQAPIEQVDASYKGYEKINLIETHPRSGNTQNYCIRKNLYGANRVKTLCLFCYYGNMSKTVNGDSIQQSYSALGVRIEDPHAGTFGNIQNDRIVVAVDENKDAEKHKPPEYLQYTMQNSIIIEPGYIIRIRLSKSKFEFVDDCTKNQDAASGLDCFFACEKKAFKEKCGCDYSQSFRMHRGIRRTVSSNYEGECDRKTGCQIIPSESSGSGTVTCGRQPTITETCLRWYEDSAKLNCTCERSCTETSFAYSTLLTAVKQDQYTTKFNYTAVVVLLSYEDHQETIIKEIYEFSDAFAYLSDLGGALGIWAGGCFITIIQILEGVFDILFRNCQKNSPIEVKPVKN